MKLRIETRKFVYGVALLLAASFSLLAASADTISIGKARELLQKLGGANWTKEQVQIKKVSPGTGNGGVIVEAQIETAFRLAKEKSEWRIAEIRLGDRQWESFELIEEALRREKIRRTNAQLQQLSDALTNYQRERGQFVAANNVAALLDQLSPSYVPNPVRLDWWGEELKYRGTATSYRLTSDGPDRKAGSKDDLVVESGVLRASQEQP